MSKARREFLQDAAWVALAMLATPLGRASAVAGTAATAGEVDYAALVPHIGTDLAVTQEGSQLETLRLVAVDQATSLRGYRNPVQAALNSFTVILRSKQPSALREGIYVFNHPKVPAFSAFVSPIKGDGRTFQIVFNRNSG